MLSRLSAEIAECYAYADECRRRAYRGVNEYEKAFWLRSEGRWFQLAKSMEFTKALAGYIREVPPKSRASRDHGEYRNLRASRSQRERRGDGVSRDHREYRNPRASQDDGACRIR